MTTKLQYPPVNFTAPKGKFTGLQEENKTMKSVTVQFLAQFACLKNNVALRELLSSPTTLNPNTLHLLERNLEFNFSDGGKKRRELQHYFSVLHSHTQRGTDISE